MRCVPILLAAVFAVALAACAVVDAVVAPPTAEDICRVPPRDGERARWASLCDGVNLPKPAPVDAPDFCSRPDAKALWPFWHDVVCK